MLMVELYRAFHGITFIVIIYSPTHIESIYKILLM